MRYNRKIAIVAACGTAFFGGAGLRAFAADQTSSSDVSQTATSNGGRVSNSSTVNLGDGSGQAVVNGQTFDLSGCNSVQVVNDVVTCDGRQLQPSGAANDTNADGQNGQAGQDGQAGQAGQDGGAADQAGASDAATQADVQKALDAANAKIAAARQALRDALQEARAIQQRAQRNNG